jgi:hypothetical protein
MVDSLLADPTDSCEPRSRLKRRLLVEQRTVITKMEYQGTIMYRRSSKILGIAETHASAESL